MKAWLFDIDGVIINPTKKNITETELVPQIIKRLESGEPVALVSGRALSWIKRNVFDEIKYQIKDEKLLDNLFISGEFGGVSAIFKNGKATERIDHQEMIPKIIIEKASKLINTQYKNIAFVDEEKEIQFTLEILKGVSMETFRKNQKEISKKLSEIVLTYDPSEELEVHDDRIATNIKNRNLNKYYAARKVLDWLKNNNLKPSIFYIFGDSLTDLEMGREIQENNNKVIFIFVGDEQIADEKFEVIQQGDFDKGTIKFLKNY